ncbi:MAG: hypothetical protein AAFV54_14910, partial [Pseudomonadota bacterium]
GGVRCLDDDLLPLIDEWRHHDAQTAIALGRLEVLETEPVVKGQTSANSFKPAQCDGGLRIMVPPFINQGEKIVVQTSDSTYLKRADS